mmetsp:Transcript_96997/g.175270  ORF Transcript_96997/g.175270 Transcript_96997/m.175270 type:complete len:261 (-) Transcript_96997:75-857(-)
MQASKSRWLVGSSKSSTEGAAKSACASATRMRQPPDMCFVFRSIGTSLSSKPRPDRIFLARGSEPVGSSSPMRSAIEFRRSSSGPKSSMIRMESSSRRSASCVMWAITASTAESSEAGASSCKWKTSIWLGTGNSRCAIAASTLLFPLPLSPIRPYLQPWHRSRQHSLTSWFPPTCNVKDSNFASLAVIGEASTPVTARRTATRFCSFVISALGSSPSSAALTAAASSALLPFSPPASLALARALAARSNFGAISSKTKQ